MIEWLWNFRDAHAAPNKTQILVKHVSSSAVVEPPAPKNKKNTSTLLHWGVLSQQPMNTHTHPVSICFEKYCPCNFKTNLRDAVTATHKCTHTHTLFQFVFNKCCYGNFKTNLRDAVTATHKCTHTHPVSICFQQIKCCYGNFKTNLRDAVTATHKCTHTHKLYVEIVTSLLHITPKPLCWVNTFATQIQEWK